MSAIIECVPNFSEGRDPFVIEAIGRSIREQEDVKLLHTDIGYDANRTVLTFIGSPDGAMEAAFQAIKTAAEYIDMRWQEGQHPRIGAADVFPFVPLRDISMEEVAACARLVGQRVGQELGIPVYLYEEAATATHRRNLAAIRKGGYENFAAKMTQPEWVPDFGPQTFNPQTGATVIGARKILLAYNLNLNTDDVNIAKTIAEMIRESGYKAKDEQGNWVQKPGLCPSVKAIGWYMQEYGRAQVSLNITDLDRTPLYLAFASCQIAAQSLGVEVTGSELIGLIPEKELLQAGAFFEPGSTKSKSAMIMAGVKALGLDELKPFEPMERILEWAITG